MLKKGGASAAGFWSGAFLAEATPHLFPYSDCYEKIFAAGFADDLLRCGFPRVRAGWSYVQSHLHSR